MSIFLSALLALSGVSHADTPDPCEVALRRHIESKGCKASVTETQASGLRSITCVDVPVYVLIDQKKFDLWADGKTPDEITAEFIAAWDVPAGMLITEVFEDVICAEVDGDFWSQIRKKVVTK